MLRLRRNLLVPAYSRKIEAASSVSLVTFHQTTRRHADDRNLDIYRPENRKSSASAQRCTEAAGRSQMHLPTLCLKLCSVPASFPCRYQRTSTKSGANMMTTRLEDNREVWRLEGVVDGSVLGAIHFGVTALIDTILLRECVQCGS